MSAFIVIVTLNTLCTTQISGLSQEFKDLHLHAKLGEGLLEYDPPKKYPDLVDQHASQVARKFVMTHIPKVPTQFKAMYGPIENVVLPGIKLPRPIKLTGIRITGLRGLQLNGLQWRMESNRVTCNVTLPFLLVGVTFDNVQIELDKYFDNAELITKISLTVRLLKLEIHGSARYNVKPTVSDPNELKLCIDKAEVDIYAKNVMYEINVLHGLEEVRYELAELMNNPLEDILDAILKVVVNEINKELLGKVDPGNVTDYLISKVVKNSSVPKELIAIKSVR